MKPIFDLSKTCYAVKRVRSSKVSTPFMVTELGSLQSLSTYAQSLPDDYVTCALLHFSKKELKKHSRPHLFALLHFLQRALNTGVLVVQASPKEASTIFKVLRWLNWACISRREPTLSFWCSPKEKRMFRKKLHSVKTAEAAIRLARDPKEEQPKVFELFPHEDWKFSLAALRQECHPTVVLFNPKESLKKRLLKDLKGRMLIHEQRTRTSNARPICKESSRKESKKG